VNHAQRRWHGAATRRRPGTRLAVDVLGRGRARLGGYGAYAPAGVPFAPAPAAERDLLRNQAQALQAQLERIQRRLNELEAEKPGNKEGFATVQGEKVKP